MSAPGVPWWALAATLARLPGNMAPLGLVLSLPNPQGPIAAACFTAGVGVGSSWRGRVIDRLGFRDGLAREGFLMAGACWLVAVSIASQASLIVVAGCAGGLGVTCSSLGIAYRAAVDGLVAKPVRVRAAGHSVDAALTEASFVLSPVLAAGLVAAGPRMALFGVAGVLAAISALIAWTRLPDSRPAAPSRSSMRSWLPAALPTYLATSGVGVGYGFILAGLPARLAELGWRPELAGALFAAMSAASMISGALLAVYGTIPAPARMSVTVGATMFAAATALVAFVPSPVLAIVAMAVFGLPLAPLSVLGSVVLAARVPASSHVQAMSVFAAAVTVASGVGLLVAAPLLSRSGATPTLAVGAAMFAALAAAAAVFPNPRRRPQPTL